MMTPRRAFARGCLFLLGCGLVFLSPVEAAAVYTKPEFDEKNCEEVLGCHVCSPEEKAQVRECASSGKVITLNCPLDGDNNGTCRDAIGGKWVAWTTTRDFLLQSTLSNNESAFQFLGITLHNKQRTP